MGIIVFTANQRSTGENRVDTRFFIPGTGDLKGDIPEAWYHGTDKASLNDFLAQDVDHFFVSLPLSSSTQDLLGKEEFDILSKRNKFITNISRGEILNENDLIDVLRAYGDDVTGIPGMAVKGFVEPRWTLQHQNHYRKITLCGTLQIALSRHI